MNYRNLHTHTLEKLFGTITLHILKQDETIRIVELKDGGGLSRTLGLVRFLNIKGQLLRKAHDEILNGGLLGKTLCDFKIDFNKEFVGSVEVNLPDWLKENFKTLEDKSVGFISNVWIIDHDVSPNRFLFSEIIEIIPPELKNKYTDKIKPLHRVNESIHSLFIDANIHMIKTENRL